MRARKFNPFKDFNDEMFNKTMYYQKKYGFEYNEDDNSYAACKRRRYKCKRTL